jgi:hypothetical protein
MFKLSARETLAGIFHRFGADSDAGEDEDEDDLVEAPAPLDTREAAAPPCAPVPDDPASRSPWTPTRLDVADELWGEGAIAPGGAEEVMRLALPFGLTAQTSLLLLGGGGGAAMRLSGELGVWVQQFESDAALANAGAKRVQRCGIALAKRASVATWDPAAPAFRKNYFTHAVGIEALDGPRPLQVLKSLSQSIKAGGQMALTQTVAAEPLDMADPAVRAWCRLERREPPRVGTAWISDPLVKAGWDLRTEEDVSARQVKLAVAGWRAFVREMRLNRPSPRRAAVVVAEAELWLRRVTLLRAGRLKVVRWHLITRG